MKKTIFCTLLIINLNVLIASPILDSLRMEVETSIKSKDKLNALYKLTRELSLRNPTKAYEEATLYFNLAKRLENNFEIARAHYILGVILHLKTEFGESVKQLHIALNMFEAQNNKEYIAETNVALASLYQITSNYDAAKKRLEYGINYFSKTNNLNRKADLYYNMGILQSYLEQYDSSLYYLQIAENLFDNVGDEIGKSRVFLSTSSILTMKKDYDLSIIYSNKALEITNKTGDLLGKQAAYTCLGVIYMEKGMLDSAKITLLNALAMDSIVQNPDMTADICHQLSKVYEQEGNPEESIKFLKKYLAYNETAFSPSSLNEFSEAINSIELEKKNKEILLKDIEAKKKKKYFALSLFFIIICVFTIIFLIIRSKKLKKEQKAKLEFYKTKENILSEELNLKSRELVASSLYLTRKDQVLQSVNRQLNHIQSTIDENGVNDTQLRKVIRELKPGMTRRTNKIFEKQFIEINPDFYSKLSERCSSLTPNERKLCAFLKLNMSTKEIAEVTHQSYRAIEVARHRLRKKLDLDRDENLSSFIASIN